MKKAILDRADEALCRVSNQKIEFVTRLGKYVLPRGYWGEAGTHASGDPHVYMTFDDGPHPNTTPQLLELLAADNLKATFFLIGSNCERHPELVQAIHEAGHLIGNHSYSHVPMPLISSKRIAQEIERTNDVIEQIVGEAPKIFRPPFGIMDQRTAKCLKEHDMTPVYWGSAPEDWLIPGPSRVIRRVMWKITDGTLIVLHEGGLLASQTLTAAKEIVYRCKSLGYQFSKVNVRAGFQGS